MTDQMSAPQMLGTEHATREGLETLLSNIGYEVMPFKSTEQSVRAHVPTEVPLTVTTTEAKGLEPTLAFAERLRARGYDVAPHLAARLFSDQEQVADVVERLRAGGVERVFVIGGDAPEPAGPFRDALSLLEAMEAVGHSFRDVGIGGYPEGHAGIPGHLVDQAVRDKAPHATRIVTQICFDAAATGRWADDLAAGGVDLPIYVGMPGPVNRQKLIRISAGIGLGRSARFLQKQQGLWRFFLPGAYDPTKLAGRLERETQKGDRKLQGLHIFTFNELEGTERWRRQMRARVGLD